MSISPRSFAKTHLIKGIKTSENKFYPPSRMLTNQRSNKTNANPSLGNSRYHAKTEFNNYFTINMDCYQNNIYTAVHKSH